MKGRSTVDKLKGLQDLNNKKQYVLDFFAELKFDADSHQYNHKETQLSSVSSTIKDYVEDFDADRIAGYVAKARKITKEEVLQEWEDKKNEACNKGDRIHQFGEYYHEYNLKPTDGYEEAVVAFWDSLPKHVVPFLFELQMFSIELGIAGTADILLYNTKTKKFILADYKTNIDLYKNYKGKKMLPPFEDLLDCPFNKYQVQLSYYQYLFEQCGFEIEDRIIIWLKSDSTFDKIRTKNFIDRVV